MGKSKGNRFEYDPLSALSNAPRLMGLDLTQTAKGWQGGYYLDGTRHMWRRDKLKVFCGRGSVWVSEEGGRCVSLPQWLIEFGRAADWKDAIRIIKGESQALHWDEKGYREVVKKVCYVDWSVVEGMKRFDLKMCPLFVWMARMFGESRVRDAWEKYNVTTDSRGNAVFWYVDQDGRVLHDKRIAYGLGGHRRKDFFPARRYQVGDGYCGRCYFGSHLVTDGAVRVVESEKAALVGYLWYGMPFVATGGKSNLRRDEVGVLLYPDLDAVEAWGCKGQVVPWWDEWGLSPEEMPKGADIADMIEWKIRSNGSVGSLGAI